MFNFVFNFIIIQEAPCWDGIWSNQDESFILDTDDFYVKITNENKSETLKIAYTPGIDFIMYYPLPEGIDYVEDYIHTGEIYRIFNYVHVKCKDGCFDTWLQKVE